MWNFMKIRPVGAKLLHADSQAVIHIGHSLKMALRNKSKQVAVMIV